MWVLLRVGFWSRSGGVRPGDSSWALLVRPAQPSARARGRASATVAVRGIVGSSLWGVRRNVGAYHGIVARRRQQLTRKIRAARAKGLASGAGAAGGAAGRGVHWQFGWGREILLPGSQERPCRHHAPRDELIT